MRVHREVHELTVAQAAYLAGLLDGEGTVTLSRKHAGEMRQLVVSISNTELEILEFARATIGAGKLTRKRTSKAHLHSNDARRASCVECSVLGLLSCGRKKEPLQPEG